MGMLLLACWAGSLDWTMQRHLQHMTRSVQGALRLAVFDWMEHLEAYQYDVQARQDEQQAHALEQAADAAHEKSDQEHHQAEITRHRAEYLQKLASLEERHGHELLDEAQHNEALRQQVLQNLTLEEKHHEQTLNQLRDIHEGVCNWTLLSHLCDTVGGVTGLQQRSNREALQIQADYRHATSLQRKERLEQLVAQMLQGKAERFHQTSQELLHVADLWDEHAQQAYNTSNITHQAHALEAEAERLEDEALQAEELEQLANLQAHQLLHTAQVDHVNAYWCAIGALFGALTAGIFFVTRAAPRAKRGLEQWPVLNDSGSSSSSSFQTIAAQHDWSYCALHVLFLGMILGMTTPYWLMLDRYTVSQRAIILVWCGFLGSTFQSFFLRALPQFMVEARAAFAHTHLLVFVWDLTVHGTVLFFLFILEVLLAYIVLGSWLFNPRALGFFNSLLYCLATVILSLVHVFYYDEHRQQQQQRTTVSSSSSSSNASVTVWQAEQPSAQLMANHKSNQYSSVGGDGDELSEFTPLNKEQILSPGTTLDLNQLGGTNSSEQSANSAAGRNPTTLQSEFARLLLPFEVLLIAAMVAVMRNSFFTLWHSQATWLQAGVFACIAALLVWGGILVKDLTCCDECYGAYGLKKDMGDDASSSATNNKSRESGFVGIKKRLDAVELVQV